MQFFVSYARLDLDQNYRESLEGFFGALENELRIPYPGATLWLDKERMVEQQDWREKLGVAIEGSGAFIILFSSDWLRSPVCWQEYERALETPHIGRERVLPILLDPSELEPAIRNDPFAKQKAALIKTVRDDTHQNYFNSGYGPVIDEAFNERHRKSVKRKPLVQSLVQSLEKALDRAPVTVRPLGAPPEILSLDAGGGPLPYVAVPSGTFFCPKAGVERSIGAGFKMMTEAKPLREILGEKMQDRVTFGDLTRDWVLPRGFGLPSAFEWEWAMGGGQSTPVLELKGRSNLLGLTVPPVDVFEPTGTWDGAPPGTDTMAKPGQHLVSKSRARQGYGRKRLSFGSRVGNVPLRLVYRGD